MLWDVFLNLNVQRLNELLCPTYLLCPFCGKQKIEKVIKVLVSRVIQSVRVRTSVRVPPAPPQVRSSILCREWTETRAEAFVLCVIRFAHKASDPESSMHEKKNKWTILYFLYLIFNHTLELRVLLVFALQKKRP